LKAKLVLLYEYEKCFFYSAQVIGDNLKDIGIDEFGDFQNRMEDGTSKDNRQLKELHKMINNIGKLYGATYEQFKREISFERLPKPDYKFYDSDGIIDFGLRLYCIRVEDADNKIVILLNGGRKTTQSAQSCPNCRDHFDFADRFSIAFYNARYMKKLEIDGFKIKTDEDYFEF
jgi:hypothetical protein